MFCEAILEIDFFKLSNKTNNQSPLDLYLMEFRRFSEWQHSLFCSKIAFLGQIADEKPAKVTRNVMLNADFIEQGSTSFVIT